MECLIFSTKMCFVYEINYGNELQTMYEIIFCSFFLNVVMSDTWKGIRLYFSPCYKQLRALARCIAQFELLTYKSLV